jgi:polyribonucleotide nucleotidyltransferase
MADRRLKHASEVVKEGGEVFVKVMGFDERGKVRLAMKGIDQKTGKEVPASEQQAAEQAAS